MSDFNPFEIHDDEPGIPTQPSAPMQPPQQARPAEPTYTPPVPPAYVPPTQPAYAPPVQQAYAPAPTEPDFPDFPPLSEQPPATAYAAPPPPPPVMQNGYAMPGQPMPPQKKKARRIWIPLTIVAALVAVVLLAGNAILLKLAPTIALSRGSAKLGVSVANRMEQTPYQPYMVLGRILTSGGKFGGGINYSDGWSDLQLGFDVTGSAKDNQFEAGFNMIYDGAPVDARVFVSRDELALTSSYLDDNWYGLTYDSFEKDLRASILPDLLGLDDAGIKQLSAMFDELAEGTVSGDVDLFEAYDTVVKDFSKSLDYQSTTADTTVGGQTVSCGAVTVDLSPEQMRQLIVGIVDAAATDKNLRDATATSLMANYAYSQAEAQSAYVSQMRDVADDVRAAMDTYTGDLQITYYLYKNELVKMTIKGDPTIDGETVLLDASYDFGLNPATDDWDISFTMTDDMGSEMRMNLHYASKESGNDYEDLFEIKFNNGYEDMLLSIGNQWNRDKGDLLVTLSVDDGYGPQSLSYGGKLICDKDSFQLEVNEVEGLPLDDGEAFALKLEGEAGAKVTEPKFVNLDRWDESVIMQFQDAVVALNDAIYGSYGG